MTRLSATLLSGAVLAATRPPRTTARATLGVLPGHNGTATLQRYVAGAWTPVGPVRFTNGLGEGFVRSATPGRVSYRYYVPKATISGGTYQAAYSPNFVLTTT